MDKDLRHRKLEIAEMPGWQSEAGLFLGLGDQDFLFKMIAKDKEGNALSMKRSSEFYAEIGRKGAEAFWNRFRNDPEFSERMGNSWKGHKVNYKKIVEAAKLRSKAFRHRYNTDKEFKQIIDKRLERMKSELVKYKYSDEFGKKFRSLLELEVANFLSSNGIVYSVGPRFECGYHAYYPDFLIQGMKSKIIEVMGIGTEKYWKNAARKIGLLLKNYPQLRIAVITSFSKMAKRHLCEMSRVNI